MSDQAIFRSVGQALHVSYLMEVLPPTQRVSTQVLIESLREQLGKVESRLASSINIGGLSPLEFRGQCAMVRGAARDHLMPPEHDAVRARFGHQRTKADGVRGLASYVEPLTQIHHEWALIGVCWSQYHRGSQRAADRWSLARIASETGVSQSQLRKAAGVIDRVGNALQERAERSLGDLFARTGLLMTDEEATA